MCIYTCLYCLDMYMHEPEPTSNFASLKYLGLLSRAKNLLGERNRTSHRVAICRTLPLGTGTLSCNGKCNSGASRARQTLTRHLMDKVARQSIREVLNFRSSSKSNDRCHYPARAHHPRSSRCPLGIAISSPSPP